VYDGKKILTFIGARGNSKGLKNKNILNFCGKPLILWTIEAALKSKYVDSVLVSTDSPEIAEISKQAGASVPFLRPSKYAEDHVPQVEAIYHSLDWLIQNNQMDYHLFMLLQPTSPLRAFRHIDQSIDFYFRNRKTDEDTLVSVKKLDPKMAWIMKEEKEGYITFCIKKSGGNRQICLPTYLPNGAIYISPIKGLVERVGFYTRKTLLFLMNEAESIDIDTIEDFKQAETSFLEILKNHI
jgi:CMP-N-acetylneuraminic acid synthetase